MSIASEQEILESGLVGELHGQVEDGEDVLEDVVDIQDELGQVVAAGEEGVQVDVASTLDLAGQAQLFQLKFLFCFLSCKR